MAAPGQGFGVHWNWSAVRLGSTAADTGPTRNDEPGLSGFYSAGQWVESWGGIPTAAQSGRNAVRALCKKDGVRFAF